MFKATTHEMATRFCFIDYDREIAIVAEMEENDQRKLMGVGRLVADATATPHTPSSSATLATASARC